MTRAEVVIRMCESWPHSYPRQIGMHKTGVSHSLRYVDIPGISRTAGTIVFLDIAQQEQRDGYFRTEDKSSVLRSSGTCAPSLISRTQFGKF